MCPGIVDLDPVFTSITLFTDRSDSPEDNSFYVVEKKMYKIVK